MIIISAIGGILIVVVVPLLDKLKIDDVVGAISVYLIRGSWGTVAKVFSNTDAKIGIQLLGIIAIRGHVFVASSIVWMAIKMIMGFQPSDDDEALSLDHAECGMKVYPKFGWGPQTI